MKSDLLPEPGVLLIAPPMMQDPNFRRSLVVLCEHTPEGTFGLILNRPLGITLAELVEGLEEGDLPLLQGGPVQTDTLHFLHTCGDLIPDAIPIRNDLHWGGDFEALKILIETGEIPSEKIRFFLGYAGWSPDQLEQEIEQGGWILAEGQEEAVFDEDPENLWRKVLRRMGDEYAVLANFPEDPRLN